MATNQVAYMGYGPLFIGLRSGGPLRFVGQVPEFKLTATETTKELQDFVKGSGTAEVVSFISKVVADITLDSLDAQNLALALQGTDQANAVTAITNEAHTAYPGALIPLTGVSPKSVTVNLVTPATWAATTAYAVGDIVKPIVGTHSYKCKTAGTSDATAPTWATDGTDTTDGTATWQDLGVFTASITNFQITSAGVYFPPQVTNIDVAGTPVTVSYTPSAGSNIQTLLQSGIEYRIVFAGKNKARQSKGLKVDVFRCILSPAKDVALIAEDFTKMQLVATILSDDTKTGDGLSTFCQIDMEYVP